MRIVTAFFIFLMMGCEAEKTEPTVVGTWNWVVTQGGIAGLTIKPSENNQKKMIFDSKGNFSLIENGKTTVSAKYELINGKSITSTELKPLITFPNDDAMKMSYLIKGDSLFLFEEVYDGFGHTYVRAK
jgi:hypothetical protein